MARLEGWGRHPVVAAPEHLSENLERASRDATLARGLGRSYGDASLPPPGGVAVGSRLADRILSFDSATGDLHAEAGLSLHDLTWIFLPQGWCSPIMPGTAYITLGGMVAADVHAKNHHVDGTVGRHLQRFKIRLVDGRTLWASRDEHPDLFRATLGGMGLTGHVLEVVLRLQRIPSPWIYAETERIPDLDRFLRGLKDAAAGWPLTMGWIDCLKRGRSMGRGILYRGRWARPEDHPPSAPPEPKKRVTVPIDAPSFLLNQLSMSLFNFGVYNSHIPKQKQGIQHPEDFFHPLDKVTAWNRCYGRRGFTQYQCVIPDDDGPQGARRFLELLTGSGAASFLCVIKDCGPEGEGLLSFPRPGTSIAVDLPVRSNTAEIVARLNDCVIAEGGRIYLAKDTFTTAEHYRAMEPRLDAFLEIQRRYDPEGRLASVQSERLGLTASTEITR